MKNLIYGGLVHNYGSPTSRKNSFLEKNYSLNIYSLACSKCVYDAKKFYHVKVCMAFAVGAVPAFTILVDHYGELKTKYKFIFWVK